MITLLIVAVLAVAGGAAYAVTRNVAPKPSTTGITFSETFSGSLNQSNWLIAQWKSADSKPGINLGAYVPDYFDFVGGPLRIFIDQRADQVNGVNSTGAAIQSKQKFGFGTYTFVMRQSSTSATPDGEGKTLTGGISSAFLYLPNSESEIDLEFLGDDNAMHGTNWMNPNPSVPPTSANKDSEKFSADQLATGFHTYQLVWTSKAVAWYIDGKLVASHYKNVPQKPAFIILQHRGTNSNLWGGTATLGVRRFAYFKSVTYTPETK